jgi:hypothetical protein
MTDFATASVRERQWLLEEALCKALHHADCPVQHDDGEAYLMGPRDPEDGSRVSLFRISDVAREVERMLS